MFAPSELPVVPVVREGRAAVPHRSHPKHHRPASRSESTLLERQGLSSVAVAEPQFARALAGHHFGQIQVHAAPSSPQAKLSVNTPGDVYEQEADRVAEQVMRMPADSAALTVVAAREQQVQRCSGCGHGSPAPGQATCSACAAQQERVQAKESPGAAPSLAPAVESQIGALRGGGSPLDGTARSWLEPRFGHDFSQVRVHTDQRAADTAQQIGARAFTLGSDIAFGPGEYQPGSDAGRKLLAHELTHVIQQGSDRVQPLLVQRACGIEDLEEEEEPGSGIVVVDQLPSGAAAGGEEAAPVAEVAAAEEPAAAANEMIEEEEANPPPVTTPTVGEVSGAQNTASTASNQNATTAPQSGGARPMLRQGSTGAAVVELQTKLNSHGAQPPLDTDGIFGPLTRNAVIAFQSSKGLVPDAIVGPLTWGELDKTPGGGGGNGGGGSGGGTAPSNVVVHGNGASAGAVAAAQDGANMVFGNLAAANQGVLAGFNVECHVIPHDKKMTDLPAFSDLKGTKTFDGRLWDDVRGIQRTRGTTIQYAVAEEDLVSIPGKPSGYGPGFLSAHEAGHALQSSGLTADQLTTVTQLFTTRRAASGPITRTTTGSGADMWLNPAWYSASNENEYFAQSVAAYHGQPYSTSDADRAQFTPGWLQTNDPGMYTLLTQIYTPSTP
jgi:hypothetical protein